MESIDLLKGIDVAITVSDIDNRIVYMNDKSREVNHGADIGTSLNECHKQQASIDMIEQMKATARSNTYTVEKGDVKKLIHQTPWYEGGKVAGLVEFSIILPSVLPNKVRKPKTE